MEMFKASNTFPAFPSFPADLARKYGTSGLFLRPFGTEQNDLAIDFSRKDLPGLITDILEQCSVGYEVGVSKEFFPELSVGKRIECLLVLASGGIKTAFSFSFKCGSCDTMLELEMTLAEIAELQKISDLQEEVEVEVGFEKFIFRKPTGRDQEKWQKSVFADEKNARQKMLSSLQISPESNEKISPENFSVIDEAFDEADPLINFFFKTVCAECETQSDFPIDLSEFALSELHRAQNFLIWTTHRLAAHYHWSEQEIFTVPHWRRMKYLELITNKKQI